MNNSFYLQGGKICLSETIYLQDKDDPKGYIYECDSFEISTETIRASLYLVCGWDYVDIDYSNRQGWVGADWFVDELQLESFSVYLWQESITEALTEQGWAIVEKPGNIKYYPKEEDYQ